MYNNYFSNFGRPLVPDDLCKDSGPEASEEKSFEILNIFPIQMYGAHTNA